MLFHNVSIIGVDCVDAPHRVSTAELSARLGSKLTALGMPANLLELLTGIKARRFWDEGVQPSEVAAMAGERVLARTGVERARVGVVVSTSVCKDFVEPSVASTVHGRLGLSAECLNFDLGNACLAFLNAIDVVGALIERGQVDYGLIVDGEGSRAITEATIERLGRPESTADDLKAQIASLTLGSGAAAMLLGRSDISPGAHRYRGSVSLAASRHNGLCRGQADQMITDSGALLTAGLELARQTWERARVALDWEADRLDEVVIHQVSRTHTVQLARALGIDTARMHAIYPELGNVGPASVPITLAKAEALGRLRPGARVGLLGIGSGLNCTMAEVIW